MFKKIISVFVSVLFIFSVVTVDLKAATIPLSSANSMDVFKINDAGILKNFAKVTSLKNFNSDMVVLNIQDFHMHPGVQQNINSIIKALVDNYSVKNVYLEGAYDTVNTNWLSNIANPDLKNAIINQLMKDGKLTGAEIYSVNNDKQNFILPLEDKKLHKENIGRLAKILADKPEVLNKLDKLEKELSIYQKKYLSTNNKNFTEVVQKHDAGKIDTGKFYKLLFAYMKKNSSVSNGQYGNIIEMSASDYPNINKYLTAYQLQSKIKLKELSKDLKTLMESLKKEISYEEYTKIVKNTNNFSDLDALIASLVVLPSEYKQKYATKQLQDFVEATRIYKEINPIELINEERSLIEQIRGALSKNKAELEISFLTDFFKYFKDFMTANISADNRQYFSEKVDSFINLWNKYSFYNKPMLELVEKMPLINEYYDVNDYRNKVFIEKINIGNRNSSNSELPISSFSSLIDGKNIVVVITGGYHTKGLTELLLKNNISYAVITPTVSGDTGNTYEKYESAVKEEAKIASQTLASAAISLIGLEQSYVIDLLKQIQKDNNFNLDDVVRFIEVINTTKEQKISYEYDKQNQKLQLSDDNTQIIITKENIEVNSLRQQQSTEVSFDSANILKEINKNIKVFSSAFSFFSTGIFYPNLFETLDGFETFLIERNLMPSITNGLIYEIDRDEQFKEDMLKQDEDALIKLAQKTYNVQYEILAKYYKDKGETIEQDEDNAESLKEVINEMETLNSKGQLLSETDDIDYVDELRQLENSVMGKLNYKPNYAVYAAGGRIGQPDVWKLAERQDVELSMITVSPRLSKDEIPYSVSHDSGLKIQTDNKGVHGDFDGTVEWYKDNELTGEDINKYKGNNAFVGYLKMVSNKTGKVSKVAVFQTYNPEDVDFSNLLVLNTSGKYKNEEEAEVFLKQGADMVVLSAPGEMPTYTNGTREAYKGEKIFSGASCSTNALQSVLLPISENGRIESVRFGGAHSRTNSEGDKEYGFEPHSSGAFKATVKLPGLQYLKGQIIGNVNRISDVMDGSILDVTIQLEEPIKGGAEEVNRLLWRASLGKYKGVLGYELLTSNVSDIVGRTEAGIVQADQTMVSADGKTVQLAVWYDNEVGYANQYLDLSYYAGMYGTMKDNMIKLLKTAEVNTKKLENKAVTLEDIYKVFRKDVMTNNAKMAIVKDEADKGNEIAKGVLNLKTTLSQKDILNVPEGPVETFVSEDLLASAKAGGYAVGAYNMNNLDQLQAIVNAATEGTNTPLMIEISEGAFGYSADNPMGMEKFNYLVETYKMIAATMPGSEMILHLDHAKNIDVAKKAIDMGFSSVMLDYSKEEISKNKEATKELVEYAHKKGARVEAEIGAVDLGDQGYTTPEQALDFVKATNVDSLAIAVGTAHGANKNNPQLQFMLISEIAYELYKNGIKTPLVLHGASAVPQDLIKRFNEAGGEKENASGVPMNDTKAAIKWKTLLDEAREDIEKKAKQDEKFDYVAARNKFEQIEKEITDKGLLEQGVISKVNVATDVLVAGAVGMKEAIQDGKGVDHIAEQQEAAQLVGGKMAALGSRGMVGDTKKNKQKVTLPEKATKTVKELINKQNVKQYNIGSVEEIQAVINNSKPGDNIVFTVDEDTAKRFNFIGYKNTEKQQQYNALVFAIEIAAQNNKDINIAVNLIKSQDIDKTLTNILKKAYQYNEKESAFELKLDKLSNSELVYLSGAIKDGAIMDLKEIANDITEKFHKYQNDKHDVRDWGKQYRNIIWMLLENINNGNIENYISREDSFETIDEVSDEVGKLDNQRKELVDETDYIEELRVLEEKLGNNVSGKPNYAVYAALGRIGQPVVWKLAERQDVELSMITVSPRYIGGKAKENLPKEIAHDSGLKVQKDNKGVHGDFDGTIQWYNVNELTYDDINKYKDNPAFGGYLKIVSNKTGKVSKVAVFGTYNPEDVDFTGKTVLNTSGKYKTEEEAEVFIKQGADMVVLSAPGEMPTYTNGTREAYKGEKIFSG
ncbi:class II fructose-bisphosphate aldolase, partial [Candidatus Ruminimicrobium bovinum]|uniref:class II fructose-bisphosphate aldolase n=1 Tax=Candidatus Ruminimicrobium bovinum TaxID=3242779 RepID=UPI0039B865E6